MIRFRYSFVLLALSVLAPIQVKAQVATGTPPFGSFGGGPDVINLANLNAHLTIPVLNKPGRGTNFTYALSYDSSIWNPVTVNGVLTWQPVSNFGWTGQTQVATGYVGYTLVLQPASCNGSQTFSDQYTHWTYYDSFGVGHPFPGSTGSFAGCNGFGGGSSSMTATALDGSGYKLSVTGGSVNSLFSSTGAAINAPLNTGSGAGSFTDRNGNQITANSNGQFFDTLSSTTPVLTAAGSGTPASPIKLTYTAPSGSAATYTINYVNYTVATNFGISSISEYKSSSNAPIPLVDNIVLPEGSKYTFTYESTPGTCNAYTGTTCVTGRVTKITLPTGGYIAYAYSGGAGTNNSGIFADGSAATLQRTVNDGTTSNSWTYAQVKGNGAASTTTITVPLLPYDSAANQTVIQFQGIYETERQVYQGPSSGTALSTIDTCYNAATIPCTATAITLPVSQRSIQSTIPGSAGLKSFHTDKFDASGNTTESDDYDFATAPPFPLVRQTLITYASLGTNLNAFRQTVTVQDGSGNIKSRQDTNYDQYSSFTGVNCITGAPNHDDAGHGCSFTARANATSVTSYTDPVTPSGGITKNFTYDSLGNLRTAQVSCCQLETFNYSTITQYAYPDSVVSGSTAPQLTNSFTYDLHLGLPLTATDPNNVVTTLTYDNLGRPVTAKTGTNPATTYTYIDSGTWSVQVCAAVQGANTSCQKSILDGLGRTVTSQLLDGTGVSYSASDTKYDPVGRAYKASNPYTSTASYWTQANFDALGRAVKTTLPDGSTSTVTYSDNTTVTSDPAGKQRKNVIDGLGRLANVFEPDPANSNALTVQTSYAYNLADEITTVTQGSQTRTYTYDALWRLTSTTTPEAGRVCFGTVSAGTCQANGYDNWGNLLYQTDARGVQRSFIYDSLNRPLGVSYSNLPSGVSAMPNVCATSGSTNNANVCYAYGTSASSHNNGRITNMTDPSGSEVYTYDQFGNVTQLTKTVGSTNFVLNYAYNLANQLIQITYPSGRVVSQNLDGIGRFSSVVGTLNGTNTTYASGFLYNTAQQLAGFQYGNNLYASFGFSQDRLQLTCIDYSTTNRNGTCANDATTRLGLQYGYMGSPTNNGQIASVTDKVDNGRSATYLYDALYRLTRAVTTGSTNYPAWGLQWNYDRYGNRLSQGTYSGCAGSICPTNSVTVSASTNQIIGAPYAYDTGGNMTNDGLNTLGYDGENRTSSATNGSGSGTYTYDGNGIRVKRISTISGTTTTTVYVFSGQKVVAEYDNGATPSSPSREYIYAGGRLLAKIDSTGAKYYHQDHLSNRMVTDPSGNVVAQVGHFPFGESWYNSTNEKLSFTSYERDKESGNDYAKARFYLSRLGRFSSPDPLPGLTSDPQSFNRYSYVLNDPINLVDPEGEYCSWDDGTSDDPPSDGGATEQECNTQGGTWIPGPSSADTTVVVTANAPDDIAIVTPTSTDQLNISMNALVNAPILAALNRLADLLSNDPKCLAFLNANAPPGTDALATLKTIANFGQYGKDLLSITQSGGGITITNAQNGPSPLNPSASIVVNAVGAFYSDSLFGRPLTADSLNNIPGNTPQARVFLLLHELSHYTGAIATDSNDPGGKIHRQNDGNIEKNCNKTLKDAKK
jgi:RHS repeat-associated protein